MQLPNNTSRQFNIAAITFSLVMGAAIACMALIDEYDMSEVAALAPVTTGCLLAGIYLAVNQWDGRGWEQLALLMEGYSMGCAFLLTFFLILFINLADAPSLFTLALGCVMAIGSIILIGLLLAIPFLFSAMRHPNQDFAISTSNCWSLDIFSTVVRSCFVSGSV